MAWHGPAFLSLFLFSSGGAFFPARKLIMFMLLQSLLPVPPFILINGYDSSVMGGYRKTGIIIIPPSVFIASTEKNINVHNVTTTTKTTAPTIVDHGLYRMRIQNDKYENTTTHSTVDDTIQFSSASNGRIAVDDVDGIGNLIANQVSGERRRRRRRQSGSNLSFTEVNSTMHQNQSRIAANVYNNFTTDSPQSNINRSKHNDYYVVGGNGGDKYDEKLFNENGERILSRKRRYLIFPPGSSVQIVYDTYQPILGYSNYLVLGITAALAWELPSKPVYLDEQLHESYAMGNLPLLNRNDKNVSKVHYTFNTKSQQSSTANSKPIINYPNTPNYYYYTNVPQMPQRIAFDKYSQSRPIDSYYYNNKNPLNSQAFPLSNVDRLDTSNKIQYYISYADKFMKQFKQLTDKIPQNRPLRPYDIKEFANIIVKNVRTKDKGSKAKTKSENRQRKHFIHPAFRKRSVDSPSQLTQLEKFDLNLHRRTRHALYRQMDTFLKTQGSNGADCILKTLCETGQRRTDEKPGSMVLEFLRAIFTLPEPVDAVEMPVHRQYDAAHASTKNCQELYPTCRESVWTSKFMY